MLLSLELRSEYQEVLTKAQAVQLCGDKDPRCPTDGINEMLVSMYTANMMHDETKVKSLIRSINAYLDNAIAEANSVTQTEIMRFMVEAKEYTWVHAKLSEVSSKLDHLIQGQEIYGSAPPVRSATVKKEPAKAKVTPIQIKQKPGNIRCKSCGKALDESEFNHVKTGDRAGKIVNPTCLNCIQQEKENSEIYKLTMEYLNELKPNAEICTSSVIKRYKRKFFSSNSVASILKYIESKGLIVLLDKSKNKNKIYRKV